MDSQPKELPILWVDPERRSSYLLAWALVLVLYLCLAQDCSLSVGLGPSRSPRFPITFPRFMNEFSLMDRSNGPVGPINDAMGFSPNAHDCNSKPMYPLRPSA